MKKFISMVMAAAMVVSLVPATAFAATGDVKATAKIVDAEEYSKPASGTDIVIEKAGAPEAQIKINSVDYKVTDSDKAKMEVTYTLNNAEFTANSAADFLKLISVEDENGKNALVGTDATYKFEAAADGNYLVKDDEVLEIGTDVVADPGKTVAKKVKEMVADDDAIAFSGTNPITMTKGINTATVYNGTVKQATDAAIVAMLEDGYTFSDPTAVTVGTTAYNTITADLPRDLDTVIANDYVANGYVRSKEVVATAAVDPRIKVEVKDDFSDDDVTFVFTGFFEKDDIISFDLASKLTKRSEGTKATVSIDSDMVTADDLVYATILGQGLKLSVKKTVDVAEEEEAYLNSNGLKIEALVDTFERTDEITLKLSKGFEFVETDLYTNKAETSQINGVTFDDDEVTFNAPVADDEFTVYGLKIEATSAKSGATATIKASAKGFDSASVEVAKVVDYKVVLSVDEDEDVPVIYSGVNVDNDGITDDSDHVSLEVTAEETFPGAWSMRKGFSFELPEGVYVTDVDVTHTENFVKTTSKNDKQDVEEKDWVEAFFNAYQDGDHLNFEFEKRVFDDVNNELEEDPATVTFTLTLVADPTFEGDVVLKLTGDLVDEQEVTIAKFVKPYTVKAEQNDLKIDYRYTEVPTAITITEAEAGLWAKGTDKAEFTFKMDKDYIDFEDDATFEVDKDSELEIKDDTNKDGGELSFYVKGESDEAATVTIKDISLFMQRNIPAGPYDLKIESSLAKGYEAQKLFASDHEKCVDGVIMSTVNNDVYGPDHDKTDKECFVGDVCDYSDVVKAAFVNVITSGRDKDDASFTTKVVVPVGESYIIAGENQVALDVPAYVSAAGYTMLPVRAVAVALGIDTQNVLWNQPTRTVTILYGQRIITMTAGQKVVYVNGSAIPASASVEITNGRTFLPMRDLATALGVTDITWDAATKTATLNGNQK